MPRLAGSGYSPPNIRSQANAHLSAIAEERALPLDLLQDVGIYVDWDKDGQFPIFIPYPHMQGVWYERQRRWLDDERKPKYMSPKHSEPHLYNPWFLGPNASIVYICEGELDTLSLITIGRPAVGMAGAGLFDRRWLHLFSHCDIVLALDGDDAGRKAEMKMAEYIDPQQLHFLKVPDGEDLNSMLIDGTLEDHVIEFEIKYGL
jgi:DNA primase